MTPAPVPAPRPSGPPTHDSAVDAVSYGFRVLGKAGFLWAPILIAATEALPLAFFPSLLDASAFPDEPDAALAFLRTALPGIVATFIVGLILGPILGAVCYRLADQFIAGDDPAPFGSGLISLAWRLFLQGLVVALAVLLALAGLLVLISALAGSPAVSGLLVAVVVAVIVLGLLVAVRLAVSAPLLLTGLGPIAALRQSWRLTAGHAGMVFRWLIVSAVLVSLMSFLISGLVDLVFTGFGRNAAGQLLGGAIVAPLNVVSSIVLILLLRVLRAPASAATGTPRPDLPEWLAPVGTGTAPPSPSVPPPPSVSPPPATSSPAASPSEPPPDEAA